MTESRRRMAPPIMTQQPPTKYAQSGEISIAYQVSGSGPLDLIVTPGHVSHLDHAWEEPSFARCLERLGSFCRLIRFDKRGTGLSDREAGIPSLEQRMDDIRAVMDSAGSERAAILGVSEGGADECALRGHLSGAHGGLDPLRNVRADWLGSRLSMGSPTRRHG